MCNVPVPRNSLYQIVSHRCSDSRVTDFKAVLQWKLPSLIYPSLATSLATPNCLQRSLWAPSDHPYGAVHNLEFSPEGKCLLAARANKAITAHDSQTGKQVHVLPRAHEDCVNIITFLNPWTFVSGSDDRTVRIWDLRSLTTPTAILSGHTGWVKNAEHDARNNLLFSVAFQDGVRKWDLKDLASYNGCSGGSLQHKLDNRIFKFTDAVRMRISSDDSRMVVSLRKNLLFVVSDFDGSQIEDVGHAPELLTDIATTGDKKRIRSRDNSVLQLAQNRTSLHIISRLQSNQYRTALSATFHPSSSSLLALRVMDIKHLNLVQELTLLYNLAPRYQLDKPVHNLDEVTRSFLKYSDENSPDDSVNLIKELCFSPDGSVLVSPYEQGVRLMAADSACTAMDTFYDCRFSSWEKELNSMEFENVASFNAGHTDAVLTCRMSDDFSLASGCMEGRVIISHPKL